MTQLDLFEEVKSCTKCKQVKPLRDFSPDKRVKLGRTARCRECITAYNRRYQKKNQEALRAYYKEWREANPERKRLLNKRWDAANPERKRRLSRQWREANKERVRLRGKQWRRNNPEAVLANHQKRRALKKAATVDDSVTPEFLAELRSSGTCAYCLESIEGNGHIDHVIPLALGGSHTAKNLVLACPSCNLSKGAKHPDEFGWPKEIS